METKYGMTIFSFGGGQESTDILYRIAKDPAFRERHVKGRLLVVGSDTGNEHKHTYENIRWCADFCKKYAIEFYWPATGSTAIPGLLSLINMSIIIP